MSKKNIAWQEFENYYKKVLLAPDDKDGANFVIQLVRMKPHTQAQEHSHENQTEIFIGLKNTGYFMINGEKKSISEGESLSVKPKIKHTVGNKGDNYFEFLAIKLNYEK